MKNLKKIIALISLLAPVSMQGFAPLTNLFLPDDSALMLPCMKQRCHKCRHKEDRHDNDRHHGKCKKFAFGLVNAEFGDAKNGKNGLGDSANVLQIVDAYQFALSAVSNPVGSTATLAAPLAALIFPLIPAAGQTLASEQSSPYLAGAQRFTGKFDQWQTTFFASYKMPFNWWGTLALSLYVPVVHKEIKDVNIVDLTGTTPAAMSAGQAALNNIIQTHLTNNLIANAQAIGGLNLSNWSKTGLGDIALMLEWNHMFKKPADQRCSFSLFAKAGVYFPSSEQQDVNKAFSMPLGNDGQWGLPLGLSFTIHSGNHVRVGIDGEIVILFDETHDRRMKTDPSQTEFLLLNKGRATLEPGITWEINIYLQWLHFWEGFSGEISYQYVAHEKDKLKNLPTGFVSSIVNSAHSLGSSDIQNLIFKLNYDCPSRWFCSPQLSLYYKVAIDGKSAISCDTFGGQFAINF